MGQMEMYPLGDAAFLFAWSDEGQTRPADIAAWAARARGREWMGVKEWVPAYRTLAVHLDLPALAAEGRAAGRSMPEEMERLAERLIRELVSSDGEMKAGLARHIRLPVVYGGTEGPDLAACAERSGMSVEQFVQAHSAAAYEVAMIGFAPGFPYLSGMPVSLAQPRQDSPRMKVPAGSVGIAGDQTGVYPVESPGGWQLIGRTTARLFQPEAEEPFLLAPGDRVTFVPTEDSTPSEREEGIDPSITAERSHAGFRRAGDVTDETAIAFEVIKPGVLTTVQDRGRSGWLAYGVSSGGSMDTVSMRTANALVGNPAESAVLEMTLIGAGFRLEREILAAVCGADMDARVDGDSLPMDRPVWLRAGATISFGRAKRGCRTYMAVAGGIATPLMLGSRSTDARAGLGGLGGRALASGDRIPLGPLSRQSERLAAAQKSAAERDGLSWSTVQWHASPMSGRSGTAGGRTVIRLIPGAEWNEFSEEGQRRLLEDRYRVEASSDRMGLRLSGPPIGRDRPVELSSHGVAPGTVQVPPNGQPIVLAAGCQPTGGYPKIAHVIGADLPLLAQCRPGDELDFVLVDLEEAWGAWQDGERNLRILQAIVRYKGVES